MTRRGGCSKSSKPTRRWLAGAFPASSLSIRLSMALMVVESRACDLNLDAVCAYTISKFGIHSLCQTRIFEYITYIGSIKLCTYRRQHTSVQLAWKMDVWKSIILYKKKKNAQLKAELVTSNATMKAFSQVCQSPRAFSFFAWINKEIFLY